MADHDSQTISGTVAIKNETKEAIALELMRMIAFREPSDGPHDRAYFLTLYRQCLKATNGQPLEDILETR